MVDDNFLSVISNMFNSPTAMLIMLVMLGVVVLIGILIIVGAYFWIKYKLYRWEVEIIAEEGQSRKIKKDRGYLKINTETGNRVFKLFKHKFDLLNVDSTKHAIGKRIQLYQVGDIQFSPLALKFFYVPVGIGDSGIGGAYWNAELPSDINWAESKLDRLFEKRKKPAGWTQYIPLLIAGFLFFVIAIVMFYGFYKMGKHDELVAQGISQMSSLAKQVIESKIPVGAK